LHDSQADLVATNNDQKKLTEMYSNIIKLSVQNVSLFMILKLGGFYQEILNFLCFVVLTLENHTKEFLVIKFN